MKGQERHSQQHYRLSSFTNTLAHARTHAGSEVTVIKVSEYDGLVSLLEVVV